MKIELEDVLWDKVKRYANAVGYSSPEEFVQHAVERHMVIPTPDADRESARQIKGLGYVDMGLDI